MEGFIFVSFNFHYDSASNNIDEPNSGVIGCHHGNVLIEKINTSDFSASRKLPIIIFDIYRFL